MLSGLIPINDTCARVFPVRARLMASMSQSENVDAQDALSRARECCERIVSVLDVSSGDLENVGNLHMLSRLHSARAAAGRACELIGLLSAMVGPKAAS